MGKWRLFALHAASSLIWGDGGFRFHFILYDVPRIACVASGSARVCRENWNESKKRNEEGGGGGYSEEGVVESLALR